MENSSKSTHSQTSTTIKEDIAKTHLLFTKLNEDLQWLIESKRIDREIELEDLRRRVRGEGTIEK